MIQLGLCEDDHVTRTMVRRGEAQRNVMGVQVGWQMLPADLTLDEEWGFFIRLLPRRL